MCYRMFILSIIVGFILIVIALCVNRSMPEDNQIMQCNTDKLKPYQKSVYINGEKVTDKLSVVVYKDKMFFSVDMLQKYISKQFILYNGDSVKIRRNIIKLSYLLGCKETLYIDYEALSQYIHINNDVYKSSGSMIIDSMLPLSFNIDGVTYYLTDEKIKNLGLNSEQVDKVLDDGRGAWANGADYLIEDDWGNLYRYEKSNVGI